MTQIKQDKAPLTGEKNIQGEIADGTVQSYGTPPKIKNKQRSSKLNQNTMKVFPDRPSNNI